MKILANDTTTPVNTVAICDGERLLAETVVECGRRHAESLLETVDWLLAETGLELEDLDALAVSIGPGSFTGVRVGLATLKGLALGKGLPLMGVPTLDAMTRLAGPRDGVICPILDAKMGEVFSAAYRFESGVRTKLRADSVGAVEAAAEDLPEHTLFLGDGAVLYEERIRRCLPGATFARGALNAPRASAVAAEALDLFQAGHNADASLVAPVYLRKSQAEMNRMKASQQ